MENDSICRCKWVKMKNPTYIKYHDEEWGVPVKDDRQMFEFLTLESFQAGLSWETILNKRENFRNAFDNFDVEKIAAYSEEKLQSLVEDKGIIRNKLKIAAAVNNAKRFIEIKEKHASFCDYFWQFSDGKSIINKWADNSSVPASTPLSDKISKELKKQGFKFMGTTVVYAHMQAVGMVNDHTTDCFRYHEIIQTYS
ncbi:DNA-3-methyladenine glycosylase I [Chondrinema litorale]|uniref:DNA-3-methyladenine glycosylase I n=1 Tax=Chondrinema litorale TaxID=2994555 RepID=UPI002542B2C3|nr:DNA-3-methyladenine glycosylase I [Chondrinema litorale]UZR94535.1 DNA-3-methyladenine glycosylase I [Chondrinema litorale]